MFHWLSEDTVKFDVNVGFYEKFAKMKQLTHTKWTFHCMVQQNDIMMLITIAK